MGINADRFIIYEPPATSPGLNCSPFSASRDCPRFISTSCLLFCLSAAWVRWCLDFPCRNLFWTSSSISDSRCSSPSTGLLLALSVGCFRRSRIASPFPCHCSAVLWPDSPSQNSIWFGALPRIFSITALAWIPPSSVVTPTLIFLID